MRIGTFALLSLSLLACGGSSESSEATTPAAAAPPPSAHDDHGAQPAQVVAFHDVLAPLWHDTSAERRAKTCAQTGELDARAAAMSEVTAADPAAWSTAVAELRGTLEQLSAACNGSGDFDASFTTVHDGFHKLAEMAGGEHGEHEHGAPSSPTAPPMPPAPHKEG
jgi:hypothetical protein